MSTSVPRGVLQWYSFPHLERCPVRADRSALGTLPTRAYRHCDALTSAAALGWYVYPPLDFSLGFDGHAVYYRLPEMDDFAELKAISFPGLQVRFNASAPSHLKDCFPQFLTAIKEPGVVQIWTGLLVRTAPGWSSLIRRPSNIATSDGFQQYEAIVETDRWFGSLFTNIRMTTTSKAVHFSTDVPLLQLAPLPQYVYSEDIHAAATGEPVGITEWSEEDWACYNTTFVAPALDPERSIGRYAVEARKLRKRAGCPMQ